MHFLRGSGVAGLRGMLPAMPSPVTAWCPIPRPTPASLRLIRPMLATRAGEIDAYCEENALRWRADASNADTHFYRNRLRHELMPSCAEYNPRITEVLARDG